MARLGKGSQPTSTTSTAATVALLLLTALLAAGGAAAQSSLFREHDMPGFCVGVQLKPGFDKDSVDPMPLEDRIKLCESHCLAIPDDGCGGFTVFSQPEFKKGMCVVQSKGSCCSANTEDFHPVKLSQDESMDIKSFYRHERC